MPFGQAKTYGFNNAPIQQIVISGTGAGTGVFVYNGTPQLGNPPITWMTNGSLVDPYGNVLPAVIGVEGVGTFSAGNTLITPSGIFVYSGTPATGNLIFSIASVAGTDEFGNPYKGGGATAYGTSGATSGLSTFNSNTDAYVFAAPGGATHMILPPELVGEVGNAGTATEFTGAALYSGSNSSGFDAAVEVFTGNNDGSSSGNGALVADGSDQLIWDNGGVETVGLLTVDAGMATAASALTGGVIISQTDISATSQTNNTTFSRLCKVWVIQAGDAVLGTTYRLTTWGSGTTGATAETLSFQIAGLGTTLAKVVLGALNFSANTSFAFDLVATLMVNQTGSSGIVSGSIRLNLGVLSTSQITGTGANQAGGYVGVGDVSVSVPTAASSMTVQMEWGAASAGQSIQSTGSIFERIGAGA